MALGLGSSLIRGGASLLTFVKDNLKLYLDFKSSRSDTLAFPSEGSTAFVESSNQYISIADSDSLSFGDGSNDSPFSISAWINPIDATRFSIASKATGSQVEWRFYCDGNDKLQLFLADDTISVNERRVSTASISQNTWTHVAATYDGSGGTSASSGMNLYINGILDNGTANGFASYSAMHNHPIPVNIGFDDYDNHYADGKMANVAIWSRVLSPEEIQSIMNKSYSQLGSVEKTSLVAWWALDSQSNGVVQPHDKETLGSELSNKDFTGWTLDGSSNWSASSATLLSHTASSAGFASSPFSTVSGKIYKVSITINSGQTGTYKLQLGASSWLLDPTDENDTWSGNHIFYVSNAGSSSNGFKIYAPSSFVGTFTDVSVKEVTSNTGVVTGATTTTSVYGGNAPILPRAIDIAESQAEAIGNGSALLVSGNSNYIEISDNDLLSFGNGSSDHAFSVSAWVYFNSTASAIVLQKGTAFASSEYSIGTDANSKMYFHLLDDGGSGTGYLGRKYNTALSTGEWYHFGATYDGSTNNSGVKLYLNGIRVDDTDAEGGTYTAMGNLTGDALIGRNDTNYSSMNISQLGIWKGELTQAQVQSLMESTSYAKIPADVKSTLGSELALDGGFDTDVSAGGSSDDWLLNSVTHEISNGRYRYTDSGTGLLRLRQSGSNKTLTLNKTHKLTFEIFDNSAYIGFFTSGETLINYSTYTVGTHTVYFTPTASHTYFEIKPSSVSPSFSMDNLSLKEVTNDLVAYYPLDADNSRGNGTDDVTTGEVLGDELVDTTTYTSVSAHAETYIRTSAVPTTGGFYKLTFDVDSYTSGSFYFTTNTGTSPRVEPLVYNAINTSIGSQVGSETYYLKINVGGGFKFKASNLGYSGSISNISLKEITSNTGVLY